MFGREDELQNKIVELEKAMADLMKCIEIMAENDRLLFDMINVVNGGKDTIRQSHYEEMKNKLTRLEALEKAAGGPEL